MNSETKSTLPLKIAAITGFLGVAFGAFGAHLLKATLLEHQSVDLWKTATTYHLIHSVLLILLAQQTSIQKKSFYLILSGTLCFSGSLYLLALFSWKWLGPITPLGGLLLLSGWISLFIQPLKHKA